MWGRRGGVLRHYICGSLLYNNRKWTLVLKDIFFRFWFLGGGSFPFSYGEMLISCLLASVVYWKSMKIQVVVPLYILSHFLIFFLPFFKPLLLSLVLKSFMVTYLGTVFSQGPCFRFSKLSESVNLSFTKLGKFAAIITSNIFFPQISPGTSLTHTLDLLVTTQGPEALPPPLCLSPGLLIGYLQVHWLFCYFHSAIEANLWIFYFRYGFLLTISIQCLFF